MADSIYLDDLNHGNNPIPAAAVAHGILMSGAIFGINPETGKLAGSPDTQCAFLFQHVKAIMSAANGSTEDIVKMTFYLQPDISRDMINAEWVRMFPDPRKRPARHTQLTEHLRQGMYLQADLIAAISG